MQNNVETGKHGMAPLGQRTLKNYSFLVAWTCYLLLRLYCNKPTIPSIIILLSYTLPAKLLKREFCFLRKCFIES